MKIIILTATIMLVGFAAMPAYADQYVRGYTRSDGTYVSPYIRSTPNGTTADNYGGR